MRICYLADGRYIHSYRWLRFFHEQGHEMHFISFSPLEPQHIRAIQEAGGIYQGELGRFHIKRFWITIQNWRWLRQFLRREKIDILHTHFLSFHAWYAALSNFHPFFLTVMGGDVCGADWEPEGRLARFFSPLALQKADFITCWSHNLVHVVRQFCLPETPVEVVHGGVDLNKFYCGNKPQYLLERLQIPPNAKIVFSPRLMRPLYNIDFIASAIQSVCKENPQVYFLFAVVATAKDEQYEKRVREIVKNSGAEDRVRFVETIPHEEMPDYYRLADITISVPVTDGTPMSVLESMASGTPVIVSDIPDYDSRYIENGKTVLAVKIGNVAALHTALLELLAHSEFAKSLVSSAYETIKTDGSFQSQMARMEEYYNSYHGNQAVSLSVR
ncbi:MAG: glycosyltransferase family 4 protein [Acidobacteriota bacterium]